jgi:FixJ family two-component response regulator
MTGQAVKTAAIEFLTKPFREQDPLDAIHRPPNLDRATRCREQSWETCAAVITLLRRANMK